MQCYALGNVVIIYIHVVFLSLRIFLKPSIFPETTIPDGC